MWHRKAVQAFAVAAVAAAFAAGTAFAQAAPDKPDDTTKKLIEETHKRMESYLREELGVTNDNEWKVLYPKIKKAQEMAGMMSNNYWAFNPADNSDEASSVKDMREKISALREAMQNKDADPKDMAQKLAAFRAARKKMKADLKAELDKTRAELTELLTPRQEALLVFRGALE